jgi:hypothetical protein
LVSGAALLSGSALSPWAVQLDSDRAASSVARQVGCELRRDFLACLQRVPLAKLMSVSLPTPAYLPRIGPPLPAVDPERAMKEKTGERKAERGSPQISPLGAPSSNIYENYPPSAKFQA